MILSLRACLFLLIALFANYVFATTENVNWSVIKTEKDLVTSNEVKEYIDHMLITDGMHAHLFKSAQEDFSTYQQNRHEIIRDTFTPTIKRMAFIRLAQTIAIHQKDRQYFQLTQRDFNRLVDNKIKTILELQTTKENPAANPVDGLVNDLKLKGFPHQKSESNDEIYQRWVKRLKFKMREESREREALSFVCSVGDCDQESPLKILTQKKRFLDRAQWFKAMRLSN
jgi:Icc-related predicted phosphoesterase